jgi:hypothetical protein
MKKIEREVLATIPVAAGCCIKDGGNGNTDIIVINH